MAALRHLKPLLKSLPQAAISKLHNIDTRTPRTLYQTLSRLPRDGVGAHVFQTRWQSKGIEGCYWEVTRVKLKNEGNHGKAWGKLIWRGKFRAACFWIVTCKSRASAKFLGMLLSRLSVPNLLRGVELLGLRSVAPRGIYLSTENGR
jgi:hypothetical protein